MKKIYIIFQNDQPIEGWHNPAMAEVERAKLAKKSDGSIQEGIFHVKSVQVMDL